MRKILSIFLSVIVGLVFLYSAWTKLDPIQSFEYTIVEYTHLPWLIAALTARLLIGLEAGIGVVMMFNLYGRSVKVLNLAIFLLGIFSCYLIYLWIIAGNDINCGCFGDNVWMSPSTSLIKNVVLIITILTIKRTYKPFYNKWVKIAGPTLFVVMAILPFILYSLPSQQPDWLKNDQFKLNLTSLYDNKVANPPPSIDLNKNKHIVAFLSIRCPHCKIAARKMHIMKENNPALPFYFVIAGNDKYLAAFWKETNAQSIPHTKLDADSFTNLIGWSWPVINWVNNGWVEAKTSYITLNQAEIEKWLKQP